MPIAKRKGARKKKRLQSTLRILGWILACLESSINFCRGSLGNDHTARICLQYLLNSQQDGKQNLIVLLSRSLCCFEFVVGIPVFERVTAEFKTLSFKRWRQIRLNSLKKNKENKKSTYFSKSYDSSLHAIRMAASAICDGWYKKQRSVCNDVSIIL